MFLLASGLIYFAGFFFFLGYGRGINEPTWKEAFFIATVWPIPLFWMYQEYFEGRRSVIVSLILFALIAAPARAGYLKTILQNPAHPHMSAGLSFNSKLDLDGGGTALALVYHDANPDDSLIPQALLDLGVRPISWAIQAGVGGDRQNFTVPFGVSANLTPTVLGPAIDAMRRSDSPMARNLAKVLDSPAGGVAFGPQWTAKPVRDGVILPINVWRFPPGYFVGGLWKLGGPK